VNALAKEEVGKYFHTHFVASFQKVATFQINGGQKQGGNVASYFCTPQNRVLHVVAGPVDDTRLLREARWAVETWKLAQLEARGSGSRLLALFRNAHAERLRREHGLDLRKAAPPAAGVPGQAAAPVYEQARFKALDSQGRVHLLLTAAPLAPLSHLYRIVFEKILDERVSSSPVEVAGTP
jgi:hypothetical protein